MDELFKKFHEQYSKTSLFKVNRLVFDGDKTEGGGTSDDAVDEDKQKDDEKPVPGKDNEEPGEQEETGTKAPSSKAKLINPYKKEPEGLSADEKKEWEKKAAEYAMEKAKLEAKKAGVPEGAIFDMGEFPGNDEDWDEKSRVFISKPKDSDNVSGPPRVIYFLHGIKGSIEESEQAIKKQVEEMRAAGENVILVIPEDRKGLWKDYDKPNAFKDLQKLVEKAAGSTVDDISFASFSGGYVGLQKILQNLEKNKDKDPEAKRLYEATKQVGLLDSAYGDSKKEKEHGRGSTEVFADWAAADPNHVLFSSHMRGGSSEQGNSELEETVKARRKEKGYGTSNIEFGLVKGSHESARNDFGKYMTRRGLNIPGKKEGDGQNKEKEPSKEKTGEKTSEGLHIPERDKDAKGGAELMQEYGKCRNDEERQKFILDQLALGNVPDSFRKFQKVEIERDGKKYTATVAPSGFRLGTDDDPIEFPMNGQLAQAVADATGCKLPTSWMVDGIYKNARENSQFIPFFPQVFSTEDANRMRSPEFVRTHNLKVLSWAKEHNIDLTKPTYGYFKQVIEQSDDTVSKNRLEIYGGQYVNGGLVQPLGVIHPPTHDDYSQQVQLVLDFRDEDGNKVDFTRHRYEYPAWMNEKVAAIRAMTAGAAIPAAKATEEPKRETRHEPQNIFTGISDEKLNQGKVTYDTDYTVAFNAKGGHVKFVETDEGNIAQLDFQGKDYQVKFDPENNAGVTSTEGYKASTGDIAGPFAYILLRYFREKKANEGEFIPFEYDGKQYIAQYQIHGPDASSPNPHPGVGIMEKKEADQYSRIPATPGTATGTASSEETGVYSGRKVASFAPPAGPPVAPTQTPEPSVQPSFAPSPAPVSVPMRVDEPKERKEGAEYIIHGSTLFLGDSNTVGSFTENNIQVEGKRKTIAEVSKDASWLLTELKRYETELHQDKWPWKNMVVTIGVNGIGMGAEKDFDLIKQIWEIGNRHGVKVYAGTLAPFKGYATFGADYEKDNETRKKINGMIREYQKNHGIPDVIIPYDRLVADPTDPDKLAEEYESGKHDHIHMDKAKNAKIVASIVGEEKK